MGPLKKRMRLMKDNTAAVEGGDAEAHPCDEAGDAEEENPGTGGAAHPMAEDMMMGEGPEENDIDVYTTKKRRLPSLKHVDDLFAQIFQAIHQAEDQPLDQDSMTEKEEDDDDWIMVVTQGFLMLKQWQRQAHDIWDQGTQRLQQGYERQVQTQARALAAWSYERQVWQHRLEELAQQQQQSWTTSNPGEGGGPSFLVQLAREDALVRQKEAELLSSRLSLQQQQEEEAAAEEAEEGAADNTKNNSKSNNDVSASKLALVPAQTWTAAAEGALVAASSAHHQLSPEETMTIFLRGANIQEPRDKQKIVARLHQELSARGALERDLKRQQQHLSQLQQEVKLLQQRLDSLPDHVATLERASLPLQKYFLASAAATPLSPALRLAATTERRNRLDQAQNLSSPLYTLFQQLQHYLDHAAMPGSPSDLRPETSNTTAAMIPAVAVDSAAPPAKSQASTTTVAIGGKHSTMALSIATTGPSGESSAPHVLLTLPVPNVTNPATPSNKRVAVHFMSWPQADGIVTAIPSKCGTTLQQDCLLEELFVQDHGYDPVTATATLTDPSAGITGKAYHWCNYLAGLALVPNERQGLAVEAAASATTEVDDLVANRRREAAQRHMSTRVILQQLQRRIRANATLKYILQALQRNQVPWPPHIPSPESASGNPASRSGGKCVLVNFVLDKDFVEPSENVPGGTASTRSLWWRRYRVVFRRDEAEWHASVKVHLARYPAVPPLWFFQYKGRDPVTDQVPANERFYQADMARLENLLQGQPLQEWIDQQTAHIASSNPPSDQADRWYEWILVHQIRLVLETLDEWYEGEEAASTGMASALRHRRGRDRAPIPKRSHL